MNLTEIRDSAIRTPGISPFGSAYASDTRQFSNSIRLHMRHIYTLAMLLIMLPGIGAGYGQALSDLDPDQPIPLNPDVRYGKLKNGLTYYIHNNPEPRGKVIMNLVVKAGYMQEDEDQTSFAHLLEHIGFQRTTNFPQGIYAHFEPFGIKRARDINGHTLSEGTFYVLKLPTDNPQLILDGLQCLRDWAGDLMLTAKNIEIERGALLEEIRRGKNKSSDLIVPRVLGDTEYARRWSADLSADVVDFKLHSLQRFYEDWYRPDLQSAIIVGDIDADNVERQIRLLFSDLRIRDKPRERIQHPAFVREAPKFITITDDNINDIRIRLYTKFAGTSNRTANDYRLSLIMALYNTMMSHRLKQIKDRYNSPVSFCRSYFKENGIDGSFSADGLIGLNVLTTMLSVDSIKYAEPGFKATFRELVRAEREGFTLPELERAKQTVIRSKAPSRLPASGDLANDYRTHFIFGSAAMDPVLKYNLTQQLIERMSLDEVNQTIRKWINSSAPDVVVVGPEAKASTLPGKTTVLRWMEQVKSMHVQSLSEETERKPELPAADIPDVFPDYSSRTIEGGITELRFASGLRVVLKPISEGGGKQELRLHGFRRGGARNFPLHQYTSARNSASIVRHSGVGHLNKFELEDYLSEKKIKVEAYVEDDWSGIRARADEDQFDLMMAVVHQFFTNPARSTLAFEDWKYQQAKWIRSREPRLAFLDSIRIFTGEGQFINYLADLDKIDFKQVHAAYQKLFGDIGQFTFILTGDFDPERIGPVLAKYLAPLPSSSQALPVPVDAVDFTRQWNDHSKFNYYYSGTEGDRVEVQLRFAGPFRITSQNTLTLDALRSLLNPVLSITLRKDVYTVYTDMNYTNHQGGRYIFTISFQCAANKEKMLVEKVFDVIESLSAGDIENALTAFRLADGREFVANEKNSSFWSDYLTRQYQDKQDPASLFERAQDAARMTPDNVISAARDYLSRESCKTFFLMPGDNRKRED